MRGRPVLLIILLFLAGCYNDKESILYPESACVPPTAPSYQADIVPILSQHCTSCHSGTFASGNVLLDSYAEVKKYTDNGQLMGTITWASGYSPMPKNGNKLPNCHVATLQTWIATGAPNN